MSGGEHGACQARIAKRNSLIQPSLRSGSPFPRGRGPEVRARRARHNSGQISRAVFLVAEYYRRPLPVARGGGRGERTLFRRHRHLKHRMALRLALEILQRGRGRHVEELADGGGNRGEIFLHDRRGVLRRQFNHGEGLGVAPVLERPAARRAQVAHPIHRAIGGEQVALSLAARPSSPASFAAAQTCGPAP